MSDKRVSQLNQMLMQHGIKSGFTLQMACGVSCFSKRGIRLDERLRIFDDRKTEDGRKENVILRRNQREKSIESLKRSHEILIGLNA
jgi:hypothetical protein